MPSPVTIRFAFATSRSSMFPWMLERARLGDYREIEIGGKPANQTTFTLPCRSVELFACEELAQLLKHKKGFAWVNDQPIDPLRLAAVLRCYGHSLLVSDVRGHCWTVLRFYKPKAWESDSLAMTHRIFPCRHAQYSGRVDLLNPATLRSQVEAMTVERSCHWCPSLQLDEWEAQHG